MKKYLLILVFSLTWLSGFAKSPNLHVEKMFDGTYNSDPTVYINISKSQDNYFRGFTVTNNSKLVKIISQLFEQDLPKAIRTQDIFSNGSHFSSMTIQNNGEEIYLGLSYDQNNGCYLFIKGPVSAFK